MRTWNVLTKVCKDDKNPTINLENPCAVSFPPQFSSSAPLQRAQVASIGFCLNWAAIDHQSSTHTLVVNHCRSL